MGQTYHDRTDWWSYILTVPTPRLVVVEDVDELAAAALAEPDHAVGGREEGVVATPADVLARVEAGAALAHDDGAGMDLRAVEHLHAEALCVRIATVLC